MNNSLCRNMISLALLLCSCAATHAQVKTTPSGAKIEETLLAAYEQGNSFQISPHGGHAATVSHHGSRPLIIYDGVPGPAFDGFTFPHGGVAPVEFSADGSRWGYCGTSSDHYTVMVDGKEIATGTATSSGRFDCAVFFSPNSKHFFFTSIVNMGDARQGLQYTRFNMDGKVDLKIAAFDNRELVFSPDGDHWTMIVADPIPGPRREQITRLLVDGKPVPFPGGSMQWSADSKHLYTTGNFSTPQGGGQDLFLDGKPLMRATRITLSIPPVGDMTVAIVNVRGQGPPPITESWFLVVGGKKVPASELTKHGGNGGGPINKVYISPDGKHYAAICTSQTGKSYVFADGKKGLEYGRLNGLGGDTQDLMAENRQQIYDVVGFTPASMKVVYLGFNDPSQYLVVGDEEEGKAPNNVSGTVASPGGDHVAVFGQGAPMLDGKYLNLGGNSPELSQTTRFRFSPDGSHYTFQQGYHIFLDGVNQTSHVWTGGTQAGLWSPDGKHLAYFCQSTSATVPPSQRGLCLDGKYISLGEGGDHRNLTFTPDSNHMFFVQGMPQAGFRLFVDGQPVLDGYPTGGGVGVFSKETFQMQPDGTLLLVAQDNAGLKRYTITPSPNTSVATLLSGAPVRAAGR